MFSGIQIHFETGQAQILIKTFGAMCLCLIIAVFTPIGAKVFAALSLILLMLLSLGVWITADVKTDHAVPLLFSQPAAASEKPKDD